MVKDYKYYQELSLNQVAKQLSLLKCSAHAEPIKKSILMGDIMLAIGMRCQKERFSGADLLHLLGNPHKQDVFEGNEIWTYEWTGNHDGIEFESQTSILLKDSIVVGLFKDGKVVGFTS